MRNWKYSEHDGKYIINDEQGVLVAMVCDAMHAELIVRQHQQLAERDRTIDLLTKQITDEVAISAKAIAQYHTLMGEANEQSEKLIEEYKELATERDGLRKALEVATDALNGILNGEWSETIDDQFLEVWTTRRINPSRIADEALFAIGQELETLGRE